MPHSPCKGEMTPTHLQKAIRHMKTSSPEVDTWSAAELKKLPMCAVETLLDIYFHRFESMTNSLTCLVKRVPLQKKERMDDPSSIRPSDLFSSILRVLSSCAFMSARPWALRVLHPSQHATNGGTFPAIAEIALRTELAAAGAMPTFAISIDFTKMFNMMSTKVAVLSAKVMGMSDLLASALERPLGGAKFFWRLPTNAKSNLHVHERGLPQGMAGSVLLAECHIAPPIWRTRWALQADPGSLIISYVDDLNLCCTTPSALLARVIEILFEFETDFALSLSSSKTKLWSTDPAECEKLVQMSGFQQTSTLSALGAEWPISYKANPSYDKERQRLEALESRLMRLQHLPIGLNLKLDLVSAACLSLLDYLNHPRIDGAKGARILVKKCLNQWYAAPEVLFHALTKPMLDPLARWLLAAYRLWRLWYHVLLLLPTEEQVKRILRAKTTRACRCVLKSSTNHSWHPRPHMIKG